MCPDNRASLEVSYVHLSQSLGKEIAASLVDAPSEMLEVRCSITRIHMHTVSNLSIRPVE